MKNRIYTSFIVFLYMTSALAQDNAVSSKTPEQLGGVYYAYPVPSVSAMPTPPDGYIPFYISHYGRHGSRWLPDDTRYEWVNAQFENVENLTGLGKRVRRQLRKIWKNAQGNGGKLTPLGARQHRQIAQRMMSRYPSQFNGDVQIIARSSTVDRCRQSMLAFTDEIRRHHPDIEMSVETHHRDMHWLVHNTKEVKELERRTKVRPHISPERFMLSLFNDPDKVFDAPQEQQKALSLKLLSELFTIATDMQDIPLHVILFNLFTRDEMEAVYESNNRRMTICNGILPQSEGIPARAAITLWQQIEEEADKAIQQYTHPTTQEGKRVGAFLRFGHDTNLYRLLSLLQLSTIHAEGFDHMDEILPMAANLQVIFYHGKTQQEDDVVVQFLHNECPATIVPKQPNNPISPILTTGGDSPAYYRWQDVKEYMARRIHDLEHLRQLNAINTMVGTAQANTLSAGLFGKGSEEHGQTLPAVLAPNGQNFWTPQTQDTEQKCIAPYYYKDSLLQGFRNSHWIVGGCTQDYGSFTVATLGGSLRTLPTERATRFSHDDEISHPHYYAVTLPDEHLTAELTATSHTAMLRVTPMQDGKVHIIIQPNSDEGQGFVAVDTLAHVVYGYNPVHRIYQGWGESAGFSGHFVLRYEESPIDFGTFDGERRYPQRNVVIQRPSPSDLTSTHHPVIASPVGIYLTFQGEEDLPLTLVMASSLISKEGALHNLEVEAKGKPFSQMQDDLANQWVERLHTIDVEDADTARVNQFYGALYRASFLPREISDVGGKAFTDYSMWDTYRAVHPLYNIIAPTLSGWMMQSLVDMYERGGWLPIFPCWNSYTAAMIGDHCAATLADAYIKGIRGFDTAKAYEAMRKNAFETPTDIHEYKDGMGRRALDSYLKYGYIPLEDGVKDAFHTEEQTSRTLEYAFDDFAVAQMAKSLGHEDDYHELMRRSQNWRNVINPYTGWADGRHADGSWEGNTDIINRKPYITEGATCHYTWYVPHDIEGLFEVISNSGVQEFRSSDNSKPTRQVKQMSVTPELLATPKLQNLVISRLDSMFTQGRYWHGNEPCHQIPYLFNHANRPDLTQKWVRHILDTEYNDTPGGLSGNDDAGQMSAWYVFSSIGFYPVCPATPYYELGSPTFRRVTFNLENGKKFTIEAENAAKENIYVQNVTLDGLPLPTPQITHEQILNGSTLHFIMKSSSTPLTPLTPSTP
ncbi:MAG: GH92 family glycosyl hydrolase [Prevotella sp.]|nr:GH92 family glycosyl hydrolase [Prevotella sp.]